MPRRQVEAGIAQSRESAAPNGFFATFAARRGNRRRRVAERDPPGPRSRRGGCGASLRPARDVPGRRASRRGHRPTTRSGGTGTRCFSRTSWGPQVDLDETYEWGQAELARIERGDAGRCRPHRARRPGRARRWPISSNDPARKLQGTDALPRLDAGQVRRRHRGARRHPLRHPRADPRLWNAASRRRRPGHLLHRAERGLLPSGPDVVGGARRRRRVLDLARAHHRLPRGRARPSPAGRPDRVPARAAQPVAPPGVVDLRARRGLGALRRAA